MMYLLHEKPSAEKTFAGEKSIEKNLREKLSA